MKISIAHGFFLPIPPASGGAMEKMWWSLAREFAARGHAVASLSRAWPGWPRDELREGVRCLRFPGFAHTGNLAANLALDAAWGLRLLPSLPPADILVTNTILLPALASRLRRSAGRVVVSLNRMPKGQLRAYGPVARIQAPSSAVATAARLAAPRLSSRIKIFPNIIQVPRAPAARPPNIKTPISIGYIGRLHPEKGLRILVEAALRLAAMPDLPAWTLTLRGPSDIPRGGGGPEFLEDLRRLGAPLIADGRLRFEPPEFAPEALAAAYADIDLFAYPSLAARGETFGVGIAEAMASGATPVVSDLPCFTDLVGHEENGLVFARDSANPDVALADALARLLRDPDLRLRLSTAAIAASARCEIGAVADAMLADFASLLCPA